jgi:BirA family transcriptional regulator, biotin operon repressor / biotin---[acetyl-CoA-carboxylase] ligase
MASYGYRIWDVRRHADLDSTNREAADLARAGAPEGVVVVADHQTAGRGRLGRTWEAPPGSSLLMTVLLRPALEAARLHLVTMAVALAASDACAEVAGFAPELKWPNDLVVQDRKLAGILAETGFEGSAPRWVVVGIGVNVNWPEELPPTLSGIAVAANHLAGHTVDRERLLARLLVQLTRRYSSLDSVAADYRSRCATIGRDVRVELPGETLRGRGVDVDDAGRLVVDTGDCVRAVAVGDVVHLR